MKLSLDEFDGNLPTLESLDGSPMETNAPVQGKADEVKEQEFHSSKANAEQNIFGDMPSPYTLPEELRRKKPESEEYDPYTSAKSGYDMYGSDNSDFSTLAEQGRGIVKVIAIVVIVISALDILGYILSFSIVGIGGAILRILAAIEFMHGKNGGRIFLIICSILTIIGGILYAVVTDGIIMQLLYSFLAIGFAVVAYLLCFDKRVKAYFGK